MKYVEDDNSVYVASSNMAPFALVSADPETSFSRMQQLSHNNTHYFYE